MSRCSSPEIVIPLDVLTTGCDNIDTFFNGGIRSGITEIVGVSGTGKSQLVMQLSITAQLPRKLGGLDGSVLYISSGGSFSSERLSQISHSFKRKYGPTLSHDPMDRIFVGRLYDMRTLMRSLEEEVPLLIQREGVRLMIIDSLATPFRYDKDNYKQGFRNDCISWVGEQLTQLFTRYKLVIVCTNQFIWTAKDHDQVPALNWRWSKWVQHRILASRDEGGIRKLSLGFSTLSTPRWLTFDVTLDGVHSSTVFEHSPFHDVTKQSTHRGLVPLKICKISRSKGTHIVLNRHKLLMIRIIGLVRNLTVHGLGWCFQLDDETGVVECESRENPIEGQYYRVIGHYQPLPPRVILRQESFK